jgi:hypothetical protein
MMFRAKLFSRLAIVTPILMILTVGVVMVLTPLSASSANRHYAELQATAQAMGDSEMANHWFWSIRSPEDLELYIRTSETIYISLVVVTGLSLFILFLLLAWRNSAGLLAEKRHRQVMTGLTALEAMYKSLTKRGD